MPALAHTPTPWTASDHGKGRFRVSAQHGYWNLLTEADAKHIVRAVNSHDLLVKALTTLLKNHQLVMMTHARYPEYAIEKMLARQDAAVALAVAEGKRALLGFDDEGEPIISAGAPDVPKNERCPSCGAAVASVFDHVDACPEPTP